MSVQPYETKQGRMYRVRWRENGHGRSRTFDNPREARAYDTEVKARKNRGEAIPRFSRETLAAAYDEWWRLRGSRLAKNTQRAHQSVWKAHVKDRFDHHGIGSLASEPQLIEELIADMRKRAVGDASQRRTLAVLSAVLTAAVQWKKIPVNPVHTTPKPPATRKRHPHPMPPVVIERIRLRMLRRATREQKEPEEATARSHADACLVVLMSYAGLRPGEALALTWADVGKRTLAIDKAVSVGEEAPTKTHAIRTVPLASALANDLGELRIAQGEPGDDRPLFSGANGDLWSEFQYRNWRRRVWKVILKDLADGEPPQPSLAEVRPYDCRGSFVSLHLRAGANPLEVAAWAGHSPQVMFSHYANVIEELRGEPVVPVEDQIDRARSAVQELEPEKLDELVASLFAFPTTGAAKLSRDKGFSDLARRFYRAPDEPGADAFA